MTIEPMELKLSRTALELFIKFRCCFYLQRRLKMKAHPMIPLTWAVATDALLKNEFDAYRANGAVHPFWVRHGLNVRCYVHENAGAGRWLSRWLQAADGDLPVAVSHRGL
jgi:hypothetical protein